jgi:hypothetical protein
MKTKQTIREEARRVEDVVIYNEHRRLADENAIMLDFVYLAASSKRSDGTYNNSREALEQKAKAILDRLNF